MPAMLFPVAPTSKSIAGVARSYKGTSRVAGVLSGPRLPCFTFPRYTAGTGA